MSGVAALLEHPVVLKSGLALLHFLWQGAALAVVASALLLALRRARPAARYVALLVVLAAMAAAPVVTFLALPELPASMPLSAAIQTSAPAQPAAPATSLPPASPVGGSGSSAATPPSPDERPHPSLASRLTEARAWLEARLAWVAAGWVIGVFVLSLRLLLGWVGVARARKRGVEPAGEQWQAALAALKERLRVSRPVRLLESAAAQVPTLIGWLRPVILLPASALSGLTPAQIEALIAHELAHVRRADYLVNVLQTVIETLLFYHPAVWWVSRRLRAEREHCCDDLAVACCGDAVAYARALADLEHLRSAAPRAALAATGGPLLCRIRRLVGVAAPPQRSSWLAGALALAAVAALAAGAYTAAEKPAPVPTVRIVLCVYHPTRFEFRATKAIPDFSQLPARIRDALVSPQVPAPKVEGIAPDRIALESSAPDGEAFAAQARLVTGLVNAVPGLMKRGSSVHTLRLTHKRLGQVTGRLLDATRAVVEERARAMDAAARVETQPPDRITVSLPGGRDAELAVKALIMPGVLEFRLVPTGYKPQTERDESGGWRTWFTDRTGKQVPTEKVLTESRIIVGGQDLETNAHVVSDPTTGVPEVAFEFRADGREKFYEFTRTHLDAFLAIAVDGHVISVPIVKAPIRDRGVIVGFASASGAEALAIALNSRPLPLGVRVVSAPQPAERPVRADFGAAQTQAQRAQMAAATTYLTHLREGELDKAKALAVFENQQAEREWEKRVREYMKHLRSGGPGWWGVAYSAQSLPLAPAGEWGIVEVQWRQPVGGSFLPGEHYTYTMRKVDGQWKMLVSADATRRGVRWVPADKP